MTMSDPIADMLTRIRNANTAKHDTVDVPASKMNVNTDKSAPRFPFLSSRTKRVTKRVLRTTRPTAQAIITGTETGKSGACIWCIY